MNPITPILDRAARGDADANREVFAAVYDELRQLAAAQRARLGVGQTFQTTAVVHEAFLRLVDRSAVSWNGRHHFFCTAARAMRDLLVDEARKSAAQKRGGGAVHVNLDDIEAVVGTSPERLIELDMALKKLEQEDADDHQIVMLRYFTGLTVNEVAEVLDTPVRTVERRWRFCRAWLARELGDSSTNA